MEWYNLKIALNVHLRMHKKDKDYRYAMATFCIIPYLVPSCNAATVSLSVRITGGERFVMPNFIYHQILYPVYPILLEGT